MPIILNQLAPETRAALGKTSGLAERYDALLEKNKNESLRDDKDAGKYVDDIVRRYKQIKATSPANEKLQQTKDSYLEQLKKHGMEVSPFSFSKPGDVAARLKELDVDPDAITQISKGMEQAGDDELVLLLGSMITSQITSEALNPVIVVHG